MAGKEEGWADNTLGDPTIDLGDRIRASLVFLCKNSTNLHEVIDQLFSHGLLSRRESQVIENEKSDYDCFRQLFTILIPRMDHGENSKHFVNAFQHSGNEHILEKLKSAVVKTDFLPMHPVASSLGVRFNVQEPVPSFFGRTNFLVDLHQQILQSQQMVADVSTIISRICVVTGLGGIGKTETIRKYIHSYGHFYQHVVWIDAEEHKTAEDQFRKLALQELDLTSKDKECNIKDFDVLLKDIYDHLCTKQILLVLDNAEVFYDSDSQRTGVSRFLPKCLPPTYLKPVIIITSRQLDWPDLHLTALPLFTTQESNAFIFRQLKLEESDANAKDAETLSETFGRLPLALQVAVAVIREESKQNDFMGIEVYTIQHLLNDYTKEKLEVLKKRPPGSPDATPLMFLWKVSLDKIRQQPHGHLANNILNVMAHLLSTNIPKKPLFFIFSSNEEKSLKKAVELLVDYSFVQNSFTNFSIHRMLQDVTLAHLDNLETPAVAHVKKGELLLVTPPLTRIMTAVRKYWPTIPKSSEAYDAVHNNLIHVTMTHVLPKAQNPSKKGLRLIKFIEFVFKEIKNTRWADAEKCCRVLITYFTNLAMPSRSASIFTSRKFKRLYYFRWQLARTLEAMGRYKEAVDICKELLSSFNSLNGPRSIRIHRKDVRSTILATKYSLASILDSQGEHEEAIKLYSSVLDLESKLHGPNHKVTLATKNNLAVALENSDRLSEAKTLHAEILEVKMKDLGPLHLSTLTTKHNMGVILEKEGRYDDALEMLREVAEVREKKVGPLHADTLISNGCIAYVLSMQGKHEDGLRIYTYVISIYEKASAASHPDCLMAKNNIALILWNQGKVDEAKEMLCHVLDIKERLLGPSHKETLTTKHNVAFVLSQQGKHSEALKLYEEVLELQTKQLGPVHPDALRTNENIGWLHLDMGNFEKAKLIAKGVLAARQATLPMDHPDCEDIEELYEKAAHFEMTPK